MESITLERLRDLPPYQSCIRSYGRPILPPLVLPPEQEVIENLRARAVLVEARVDEYRQKKLNLMDIVQGLTNAVIVSFTREAQNALKNDTSLNNNHQLQGDSFLSLSENSNCNPATNGQNTFRSGIHYEEIIADDDDEEEENLILPNPTTLNSAQEELNMKCYDENSVESVVPASINTWVLDSSAENENSNEAKTLELDDTESASMLTVILKTDKDARSDVDNDSSVLSANQSTDLEKYLDSSFENSQFSESSVVMEDGKDDCHTSTVSESSATLVGDSHRSTPVQLSFENCADDQTVSDAPFEELDKAASLNSVDNLSVSVPLTETSLNSLDNRRPSPIRNNNNSEGETSKSWLRKVLTQVQVKADANEAQKPDDRDTKGAEKKRSRHLRSSSYTLDSPSPVLVLAHAGCSCVNSPKCITSPHCTSVYSIDESDIVENKNSLNSSQLLSSSCSEMKSDTLTMSKSKPSLSLTFTKSDSGTEVKPNLSTSVVNAASVKETVPLTKLHSNEKSEHNESGSEISLRQLYEKFVAMREKTFNDLHAEHVKQWKELSDDFEEKEKLFRERLSALEQANSLRSNSSCSFTSKGAMLAKSPVFTPKSPHENQTIVPSPAVTPQKPPVDLSAVSFCKSPVITPSSPSIYCASDKSPNDSLRSSVPHQHVFSTPISLMRSYMTNNNILTLKNAHKIHRDVSDPDMQKKFEKVSAAVKGYLTRRLLNTKKVQTLIKILKDCALQSLQLQEKASRGETITAKDMEFNKAIFRQIAVADAELFDILYNISTKERMKIISESRELTKQERKEATKPSPPMPFFKLKNEQPSVPSSCPTSQRKLSSATLKALERKRLRSATENRSCSVLDSRLRKMNSSNKPCGRKRILSPRSCSISPTSVKNYSKAASPNKKNMGRTIILKPRETEWANLAMQNQ